MMDYTNGFGLTIESHSETRYEIMIGSGILASGLNRLLALFPHAEKALVVTDANVAGLYLEDVKSAISAMGLRPSALIFSAGETSKSQENLNAIYHGLYGDGFGRGDVIIALGGGVIGDLAAFAAATYMRGVPLVQIPTTILAQADSSIGGKCAINMFGGKNNIGAFYEPALVIADTALIGTLPPREYAAGFAEIIKSAAIADTNLFADLERYRSSMPLKQAIYAACAVKKRFVQADLHDLGVRHTLNFGHTVGHAIEIASGYGILHGEAVALGMLAALRIGIRLGITPPSIYERLETVLRAFELPTEIPDAYSGFGRFLVTDKKRESDSIKFVLLEDFAKPQIRAVPIETVMELAI